MGFISRYDNIWYNSTNNHLISNYKPNSAHDLFLDDDLYDVQLSHNQQKNLSDQIASGNLLNISFNNKLPDCCDYSYYKLEVRTTGDANSISWTPANIGDSSNYRKLPSTVLKIVDTLEQYITNSTIIFSE